MSKEIWDDVENIIGFFNFGDKNRQRLIAAWRRGRALERVAEAAKRMSDLRAATVFIESEEHVADFFSKVDQALADLEKLG